MAMNGKPHRRTDVSGGSAPRKFFKVHRRIIRLAREGVGIVAPLQTRSRGLTACIISSFTSSQGPGSPAMVAESLRGRHRRTHPAYRPLAGNRCGGPSCRRWSPCHHAVAERLCGSFSFIHQRLRNPSRAVSPRQGIALASLPPHSGTLPRLHDTSIPTGLWRETVVVGRHVGVGVHAGMQSRSVPECGGPACGTAARHRSAPVGERLCGSFSFIHQRLRNPSRAVSPRQGIALASLPPHSGTLPRLHDTSIPPRPLRTIAFPFPSPPRDCRHASQP
ncbi:hypothetical protein SAMN02745166_02207 [Prosthecobacter debontii]|uniref:Uncharacterized protein n=1 Tax=Prosthecobacter debontii TaxID=48467 RepID=A0A1T4XZ60_9BACT|nr:hypothetical protein SAMN02745166_02207 [Prosthecobacter debontii]